MTNVTFEETFQAVIGCIQGLDSILDSGSNDPRLAANLKDADIAVLDLKESLDFVEEKLKPLVYEMRKNGKENSEITGLLLTSLVLCILKYTPMQPKDILQAIASICNQLNDIAGRLNKIQESQNDDN